MSYDSAYTRGITGTVSYTPLPDPSVEGASSNPLFKLSTDAALLAQKLSTSQASDIGLGETVYSDILAP